MSKAYGGPRGGLYTEASEKTKVSPRKKIKRKKHHQLRAVTIAIPTQEYLCCCFINHSKMSKLGHREKKYRRAAEKKSHIAPPPSLL